MEHLLKAEYQPLVGLLEICVGLTTPKEYVLLVMVEASE